MGTWSVEPWGSDEAADWFHRFWKKGGISVLIDTIENFDEKEEKYDEIRAPAYLLEVLGISYVWPVDYLGALNGLLDKAIDILEKMINPPNDNWVYLDMGGDVGELVRAVELQLAELRKRRPSIVGPT